MSEQRDSLLKDLSDAVVEMDEDKSVATANAVIENNFDAYEAIDKGLSDGMERAGQLFDEDEYFVPELLLCSDAMYAGIGVLQPHIKVEGSSKKARVVIGVIEGDTHDIGKNLVKIMLEAAGFELYDLGRDVPPQEFVKKARDVSADLIAISTLMTTTMDGMQEVVRLLNQEDLHDTVKVIVGGAPISQSFAERIGADGYAGNAAEAAKLAKRIVGLAASV